MFQPSENKENIAAMNRGGETQQKVLLFYLVTKLTGDAVSVQEKYRLQGLSQRIIEQRPGSSTQNVTALEEAKQFLTNQGKVKQYQRIKYQLREASKLQYNSKLIAQILNVLWSIYKDKNSPQQQQQQRGQLSPIRESMISSDTPTSEQKNLQTSQEIPVQPEARSAQMQVDAKDSQFQIQNVYRDNELNEASLVQDAIYACQGINGQVAQFKENNDPRIGGAYVPNKEYNIDAKQSTLFQIITEAGWLYKQLRNSVGRHFVEGAIRQAMFATIHQDLSNYLSLLSKLQQQSRGQIPFPGQNQQSQRQYLTLLRLHLQLIQPTKKLKILNLLVDSTSGFKGGQLLGAVYKMSKHGNQQVHSWIYSILKAMFSPMLYIMGRWLYEGLLEDDYNEFFIIKNLDKHEGVAKAKIKHLYQRDLWRDGYSIDWSMLPQWISQQNTLQILRAGKSINFLRECCNDTQLVQEAISGEHQLEEALQKVDIENVDKLETIIAQASTRVDQHLVQLLFNNFELNKYLYALKQYMLMGHGDFSLTLIQFLKEELDKSALEVSEVSIMRYIRQAIANSSAKFDDEDILEKLKIVVSEGAGKESGWDVFSLAFEFQEPLSTIITQESLVMYLSVFTLLWRLRRVEVLLNVSWKNLHSINQTLNTFVPFYQQRASKVNTTQSQLSARRAGQDSYNQAWGVLKYLISLRNEMSHFVTNLQTYLMLEVIEGQWEVFQEELSNVQDLDQIIEAHENFIGTVVNKCLSDQDHDQLRQTLEDIFKCIMEVNVPIKVMEQEVLYAKQNFKQYKLQSSRRDYKWGSDNLDSNAIQFNSDKLRNVLHQARDIKNQYEDQLRLFTESLPPQKRIDLRFLIFRLHFKQSP